MDKEQAKELWPIIKAYAEGETIQFYSRGSSQPQWEDVLSDGNLDFSAHFSRYRIKPESKYRPFENKKECWEEMQKHQPIGWIKSGELLINIISIGAGITVHNSINNCGYSFKSAFSLKFADGTPFGIKED